MPPPASFSISDAKTLELGVHLHDLLARETRALALHDLDGLAELTVRRRQCMARWTTCLGTLDGKTGQIARALDLRLRTMATSNDEMARHVLTLQADALLAVLTGHGRRTIAPIAETTCALEREHAPPMAA